MQDRWQTQQRQLASDKLTEYMLAHPERADEIAEAAKANWGIDLSPYRPSDAQLTSPLVGAVVNAKNELDLPSMDELVAQMQALGRPSLLAPGPTRRTADPGATPLPSTPLGDAQAPGAQPDAARLPSVSFSEGANPLVERLVRMRSAKLGGFQTQRDIEAGQKERVARSEAYGRETGTTQGMAEGMNERAAVEQALAEGRETGQNSPLVGDLKLRQFEKMTPAEVERAALIAAATRRGQLRTEQEFGIGDFADPAIDPEVRTTMSGRRYLDLDLFRGPAREKARLAAGEAGVVTVNKATAQGMEELDAARMNQKAMLEAVMGSLPKTPEGRILGGALKNKISRYLQTNEQLAAFGSFRAAAIHTLRALAGSRGLRINIPEIQLSISNDIPQESDTVGTALQRIKNVLTMLENIERASLVADRSQFVEKGK